MESSSPAVADNGCNETLRDQGGHLATQRLRELGLKIFANLAERKQHFLFRYAGEKAGRSGSHIRRDSWRGTIMSARRIWGGSLTFDEPLSHLPGHKFV